ncbi:phosphopantetheine-binding protein [Ethanoligenens harbinense]|uniref:Carrier domain-containing protein n=1 Tax=Ethanoligenens harbinense (strain DSM 18485 / JCM 12961 / CGMCC 1.5033 / YUAN-3) TaxID=663278 RepID=E6U7B3_ETHHY|nr:phosphopantetheine-binding protein [Ethanoligenens harbinense]ADU25848.1 hypothetical protein Ethha_0262 [Ethanoligenens harbinense YUAN-3]AVQ95009.1 D-alanyl carrier protein [Ethanoligenens harbinense YUAN-3]AYF37701.1 D-alanyl carrier protein [Ethanoligenens harbinense]AYF40421.1 D-alanyl carrier protein [Ethanoligenens harbinense]QCN91256.1 acyl carrier protein [Ethanoligenens harbinense]
MQENEKIKETLKEFLGRFFDLESVSDDEDLYQQGYVNSLFSVQLVMFLENDFHFSIDQEDLNLENFNSINHILHFIDTKASTMKEGV